MQLIEAIEIDRIVIHGVNNMADEPEIADREEILSEGLKFFFEEHIRTCIKSSSTLTAKFKHSDSTVASCTAALIERPEDFVEQSKVIGLWFAHNMGKSGQLQTFLAVVAFSDPDTDERYLALLKLDPVRAFVRSGEGKSFEAIQIMPEPGKALGRFAIVRAFDDENRYDALYRNYSSSKDEDPELAGMWLEGFLEADDVPTPRHMTQLVVKETERWISQNEDMVQEEAAGALRGAVRTMAQSEEMDVEAIATATIPEPEQRENYIKRLLDKGLPDTTFEPDRVWAERSARKITYMCDDGVQISGPSDVIDEVVQILPRTTDHKTRVVVETRKFLQK